MQHEMDETYKNIKMKMPKRPKDKKKVASSWLQVQDRVFGRNGIDKNGRV